VQELLGPPSACSGNGHVVHCFSSELCARSGEDYKDLVSKKTVKVELKPLWQTMPLATTHFAKKAATMFEEAGDKFGALSVKITEAGIALKAKNFAEAGRIAEETIAKFKDMGEFHGEAAAQYAFYEVCLKDDKIHDAVQALDSIVSCLSSVTVDSSASEQPKPAMGMGFGLLISADLQRRQGDLQDAVTRAADAAQQFHNAGAGDQKGKAVLSMAKSFFASEQLVDTIEAAEASVQLFKASRNKAGQAQALAMIAECLSRSGEKPEAVFRLEEAAFLYRQLKDKKNEGITLNSLSKIQVAMIESGAKVAVSEPLRHAKRCTTLLEESWSDQILESAEANYTVCKLMFDQKDELEEAVKFGDKSRSVFQKLGNTMGEAAASAILAQIYFEEKDNEQGQAMSQAALELAQDTGDSAMIALANDLITNQGKKKEAPSIELSDMDIIFHKVRLCAFVEFESRRAKYSSVGGDKKDEAADGAQDSSKLAEQKVQYVIRWQRVANLNLAAVPTAAN